MNFFEEFDCLEDDDKLIFLLAVSESLPVEEEQNKNKQNGNFKLEDFDGIKEFLKNNNFTGNAENFISDSLNNLVETKFAFLGNDGKIIFKKEIVENIVYGKNFKGDSEIFQKIIFDDFTKAEYGIYLEKSAQEMKNLIEPLTENDKKDLKELAKEFDSAKEIQDLFEN